MRTHAARGGRLACHRLIAPPRARSLDDYTDVHGAEELADEHAAEAVAQGLRQAAEARKRREEAVRARPGLAQLARSAARSGLAQLARQAARAVSCHVFLR